MNRDTEALVVCLELLVVRNCTEVSVLPHHASSGWPALTPCSPSNQFQNCHNCFQGTAPPKAFVRTSLRFFQDTPSHRSSSFITICIGELKNLDLLINAKKSTCIRIGKNFKTGCSVICIDSFRLQWSDKMVYLGITILSSTRFSIDLKPSRSKFYRSFNALYCKICKSDVFLIVSLFKSFCMPLVMFSLEAINLNASCLIVSIVCYLMHSGRSLKRRIVIL